MDSPLSNVTLHLVDSIDKAMELKRWLGERHDGGIGLDTESGGLSPYRDRLRMVQFGDKRTGWAVPFERWGGVALEILDAWEGDWIIHNSPYDYRVFSRQAGITLPWHKIQCTLTMARLDNPARDNRQKPLAKRLIDPYADAGQKNLHEGMSAHKWTWDTVPVDYPPYWIYAALDPVEACHLADHFSPLMVGDLGECYDLERAANRIAVGMMDRGMQLDVPYVEKARTDFAVTVEQIRGWLVTTHDITSPKSGGQIRRAMEALGQRIVYWTDNGAPQFDKTALEYYQNLGVNGAVRQLARYIRAVRHIEDISTRYLANFLTLRDDADVIHCNINVMGARTGRMSASDPALHQLPRDDKVIRGSYVPRPRRVYITCDLDQVEMRLLAHLSEDPGLIAAFLEADRGGTDFFTAVARMLHRDDGIPKADPRRQLIKNACYARAYGSGRENLAITAGVTVDEIIRFERMFDERFPGMKRVMNELVDNGRAMTRRGEQPGVRLPSGRFLPGDMGKEYALLNYAIQGPAAEYMKQCMIRADDAGLGEFMLLPIHDEILLEVPAEMAEDAKRTIEACMSDPTTFRVPITAGATILRERWTKAA